MPHSQRRQPESWLVYPRRMQGSDVFCVQVFGDMCVAVTRTVARYIGVQGVRNRNGSYMTAEKFLHALIRAHAKPLSWGARPMVATEHRESDVRRVGISASSKHKGIAIEPPCARTSSSSRKLRALLLKTLQFLDSRQPARTLRTQGRAGRACPSLGRFGRLRRMEFWVLWHCRVPGDDREDHRTFTLPMFHGAKG